MRFLAKAEAAKKAISDNFSSFFGGLVIDVIVLVPPSTLIQYT